MFESGEEVVDRSEEIFILDWFLIQYIQASTTGFWLGASTERNSSFLLGAFFGYVRDMTKGWYKMADIPINSLTMFKMKGVWAPYYTSIFCIKMTKSQCLK